ncbi:hypothetical protein YPPY45_4800, partial [Yersinia pestis PY-45]
MARRT